MKRLLLLFLPFIASAQVVFHTIPAIREDFNGFSTGNLLTIDSKWKVITTFPSISPNLQVTASGDIVGITTSGNSHYGGLYFDSLMAVKGLKVGFKVTSLGDADSTGFPNYGIRFGMFTGKDFVTSDRVLAGGTTSTRGWDVAIGNGSGKVEEFSAGSFNAQSDISVAAGDTVWMEIGIDGRSIKVYEGANPTQLFSRTGDPFIFPWNVFQHESVYVWIMLNQLNSAPKIDDFRVWNSMLPDVSPVDTVAPIISSFLPVPAVKDSGQLGWLEVRLTDAFGLDSLYVYTRDSATSDLVVDKIKYTTEKSATYETPHITRSIGTYNTWWRATDDEGNVRTGDSIKFRVRARINKIITTYYQIDYTFPRLEQDNLQTVIYNNQVSYVTILSEHFVVTNSSPFFAFARSADSVAVVTANSHAPYGSGRNMLREAVRAIHAGGAKALMAVFVYQGAPTGWAASPSQRTTIVNYTTGVAQRYGFDGIVINWEDFAGYPSTTNEAAVLSAYRAKLDTWSPPGTLVLTPPAEDKRVSSLAQYVDFIETEMYGFNTQKHPDDPYLQLMSPLHAVSADSSLPLFQWGINYDGILNGEDCAFCGTNSFGDSLNFGADYLFYGAKFLAARGVPYEKIVVGTATHGYAKATTHTLYEVDDSDCPGCQGILVGFQQMENIKENGGEDHTDPTAQVPYMQYNVPSDKLPNDSFNQQYAGPHFFTWEDSVSWKTKFDWNILYGFRGSMLFDLYWGATTTNQTSDLSPSWTGSTSNNIPLELAARQYGEFGVDYTAPSAPTVIPVPLFPQAGDTGIAISSFRLILDPADSKNNYFTYQVLNQAGTDTVLEMTVYDTTMVAYLTTLTRNTTYMWRAKAGNASGETDYSDLFNFKTTSVIPPPPKPPRQTQLIQPFRTTRAAIDTLYYKVLIDSSTVQP